MANEQSYTVKLMSKPNQVDESCICPKCHNDDMDTLEIHEDDTVKCLECGNIYNV